MGCNCCANIEWSMHLYDKFLFVQRRKYFCNMKCYWINEITWLGFTDSKKHGWCRQEWYSLSAFKPWRMAKPHSFCSAITSMACWIQFQAICCHKIWEHNSWIWPLVRVASSFWFVLPTLSLESRLALILHNALVQVIRTFDRIEVATL